MVDLLTKNIQKWMATCPDDARKLSGHTCELVTLCKTGDDEWNLKQEEDGKVEYFHSSKGALKEAQEWFDGLELYNVQTLFVYGVGAGYGYLAAKDWLKENDKRMLVFLEDNMEVIHRLFETEIGEELISDEQVRLQYFQKSSIENKDGLASGIYAIPLHHFLCETHISSLNYYREKFENNYYFVVAELEIIKNLKAVQILEYMNFGEVFFENFYRNLFNLPTSHLADKAFGEYENVPAIICGAGPSLEKNLSVLEKLSDRAIVIAGGSSINVINDNGFLPHFGVSIDPNWHQHARLFMNQSYEVPFFYRNRMFPDALSFLHGEHLYVKGSGGHGVAKWFEDKLGLSGEEIQEGNNVVNFGVAIAHALGCNPIIIVGLDLAYSDYRSYAKGILPHPILNANREIGTRAPDEDLILRKGVDGQPVHTLWKWVREALWMTQFAISNPKLKMINATEGGIPCEGIPNMALEHVADSFLTKPFDIKTYVHTEIQNSKMPSEVNHDHINALMEEMKESLDKCGEYCKQLRKEFNIVLKEIEKTKKAPANLVTQKALGLLKELNQESAYEAILKSFNEAFVKYLGADITQLGTSTEEDPLMLHIKRVQFNKRRYEFLRAVCKRNINYLNDTIEVDRLRKQITDALFSEEAAKKKELKEANKKLEECVYEVDNNHFRIKDDVLQLSIEEELITTPSIEVSSVFSKDLETLHGHYVLKYPSGAKKMELYYRDGVMHGPSTSYSEEGTVLARSWFVNGKQEGKAVFYYPNGDLFSIESYKAGMREGEHAHFYPTGIIKSKIPYKDGKIDGVTLLFYPSGGEKREIYFKEGKRNGLERTWNLGGIKEFEVTYKDDTPVGVASSWYSLGQLAREITYNDQGKVLEIKGWNPDGTAIPGETFEFRDYFDIVEKQTEELTHSLETVFDEVKQMASTVPQSKTVEYDIEKDLLELKEEMDKLKEFGVDFEKKRVSSETSESLWKTPETRKMLGKQMQEAAEQMTDDVKAIEEILRLTSGLLGKEPPTKGQDKQSEDESSQQ